MGISSVWAETINVDVSCEDSDESTSICDDGTTHRTVQGAVSAAVSGDTISIAAGTYSIDSDMTIDKKLVVQGSGRGQDPSVDTILELTSSSSTSIDLTAGGLSADDRMEIRDLRVTDTKSSHIGAARSVEIISSGFFLFDNVAMSGNIGTALMIRGDLPGGAGTANVIVRNSDFSNNAQLSCSNPADIHFFLFEGDATLENVSIDVGSGDHSCTAGDNTSNSYGIQFRGNGDSSPAGTIVLQDVTITGNPNKVGLLIQEYSDVSGFSLANVDLSGVTPGWNTMVVSHVGSQEFPLGNTKLSDLSLWNSGGVDATSATFVGSQTNFEIEDVVSHALDNDGLGLATWISGNVYVTSGSASIQRGIDAVSGGGTVNVDSGTFSENLSIGKSLTLQGAGKAETVIQGGTGNGITLSSPSIDGLDVKDLTIEGFDDSGIKASGGGTLTDLLIEDVKLSDSGYGFFLDGVSTTDAVFRKVDASDNTKLSFSRGLFFKNSVLENITIEDGTFNGNGLVGIDFNILGSSGQITGITIRDNTVQNNGDSGISVLGATDLLVSGNEVTDNGRFGIELKIPSGNGEESGTGSVVVDGNTVRRTVAPTDDRDHGGIVVIERDRSQIPSDFGDTGGVVIKGNTVDGYTQSSVSDGFGIAVEGTDNKVQGNTISNNDVGVQMQQGHDGDQSNLDDDFFGRGSADSSSGLVNDNTISSNTVGVRNAGIPSSIDARNNYWGHLSGPTHSSNSDGQGDPVTDNVDFDPRFVNQDRTTLSNKIPQIVSLFASDPKSPQVASFDDGDIITVTFSESTNRPSAATKEDIDGLFDFSQNLGADYSGTWNSPSVLVITILDSTGSTPPTVGTLTATLKDGGNLKNDEETSPASTDTSPALTGSFGTKAGPSIASLKADDPDGADAVYGDDDTITVRFSEATNQPPVATKNELDSLLSFSQNLGSDYSGQWKNALTLAITINDASGSTPPQISQLTATVKSGGNLKDSEKTSLVSTSTSPPLTGTFGTKDGPFIASVVAEDPDGADAVYGDGDTITVRFSEETNQPTAATKSDLDTIFSFSQNLGSGYFGKWRDSLTLLITIDDSSGSAPPQVDQLTLTAKSGGNLKNSAETSLPSTDTSPALTGNFGTKPGPSIESLTANDPDGGDAVYGKGDTITVRFSEETNRPLAASKKQIDSLFEFKQGGSTISLGKKYIGSWISPSVFEIKILDATGSGTPQVGQFTATVKSGGNLKNSAETSLPSTDTSPVLEGSFGSKSGPSIVSLVADDPDGGDAVFSVDDIIRVRFSENTNTPDVSTKAALDNLFVFSQSIGDNYSGSWLNSRTLLINIEDATSEDPPTVGDLVLTVKSSGGLKDSAGTSLSSTSVSPPLSGTFGTKDGPFITSVVAEDPDGADAIYGNDDTITVRFSEPINEPDPTPETAGLSKSDLDAIFSFSQNLGDDYSGEWKNPLTSVITIDDSNGAAPPAIGTLRITVKEGGNLKNSAETSLPSTSVSQTLEGTFGTKPGPSIESLTANDPDGGDAVYGNKDTITAVFSEPTNRKDPTPGTAELSKSDIDAIFSFSQSLGDGYTGTWTTPFILRITITDATNADAQIGVLTATVKTSANLKNAPNTSQASADTSPELVGSFGEREGPSIKSVVADDPDNGDAIYSNGDTITVRFSEPTNEPDPTSGTAELTRDDVDTIFAFSQYLGDDYKGEWINPVTLRITILDSTTDDPPAVGDLVVVVQEDGNLKNADGTSLASTATSPELAGSFGTFTETIPVRDGGSATATLPSGITTSVSLPSGKSSTFTIQRSDASEPKPGSRIASFLGDTVEISPDEGNPCTVDDPCPIEFEFDRADAEEKGIAPEDVKVMHDINDDGDFDDEEEIDENTEVTQIDANTFRAASSTDSFSDFALGSTSSTAPSSSGGGGGASSRPTIQTGQQFSFSEISEDIDGAITETELSEITEPNVLRTGERQFFRFDIHDDGGINDIQHASLYMNIRGTEINRHDSDTNIEFNKYEKTQVTVRDPNGFFARDDDQSAQGSSKTDADFKILQKGSAGDLTLQFEVTFAKPMDTSHLILYVWDEARSDAEKKFLNSIRVVESKGIADKADKQPSAVETNAEEQIDPEPGIDVWSVEQKLVIEMWAGYQPEPASDYDVLRKVYFEPLGKQDEIMSKESYSIPSWVKQSLGSWVVEGKVGFGEFANAIKYMHERGLLSAEG